MVVFDKTETLNKLESICECNSMTCSLMKKIYWLRLRGVNNTDISKKLGVHRVTVQRYIDAIKNMDENDLKIVVLGTLAEMNKIKAELKECD